MLRFESLHFFLTELEVRLELRHASPALFALLIQSAELLLQSRKTTERFLAGGDLRVLRLDVALHGREAFLRPLEGLFEDLQAEQLLEHREALRPARGPEFLHLLLPHEGRIPEAVVVEADDVADRPLLVRDRALDRFPVSGDLEVRFLLRREAASDVPAPVRPVMTVYFSGNRSGGTVFSRYRMNPRISISSRTNPPGPGVGSRFGTAAVSISASALRRAPPSRPGGPPP